MNTQRTHGGFLPCGKRSHRRQRQVPDGKRRKRTRKGTYKIPRGGIEHGEDPVEAVKREVKEETGLEVTSVDGLIGVFNSYSSKDNHPVIVHVFSCQVEDGKPEPQKDEEILEAEFKDPDNLQRDKLRNDIVERAIRLKSSESLLSAENFEEYIHPYMDSEPTPD